MTGGQRIPIEDGYGDVLGKAARGLGLVPGELARRAGISESNARAALDGFYEPNTAERLAGVLGLRVDALRGLALGLWYPEVPPVSGLQMHTSDYFAMSVNAYLVWDEATCEAALFDTGADARPLIEFARTEGLAVRDVFLTHAHGDHVADLGRVVEQTGARVWIAAAEGFAGAEGFEHGRTFHVGGLVIETRRTSGHSPGGTTYVIDGLEVPVAVVGDALFAGSMGGPKHDYAEALRTNLDAIYSLPDETVLCPGHGPMTTVGQEKRWNPFYQSTGSAAR